MNFKKYSTNEDEIEFLHYSITEIAEKCIYVIVFMPLRSDATLLYGLKHLSTVVSILIAAKLEP